jgi:transposase-like protein
MKKYDEAFKKEAVKKYLDGQTVASISREIGVNENTIHKWKKDLLTVNGELDQEKLLMRKRIFELEQENEILKNVWLRRRSQPSSKTFWHQAGRMQQMYPASVL